MIDLINYLATETKEIHPWFQTAFFLVFFGGVGMLLLAIIQIISVSWDKIKRKLRN